MPLFLLDDDPDFARGEAFCAAAMAAGAYLHPRHDMVLRAAHTEGDMDGVLEAADAGFRAIRALPPA